MALLEEACEEANDTLIRRFGGSGLTYVSVYFPEPATNLIVDLLIGQDQMIFILQRLS